MRKIEELGRPAILTLDPYVPGKPIEEVEREFGITGVIKMASNENPLGPSPAVIEALKAAAPRVFNYPDSNCYYLKREMASFYSLSEDHFIFGNGADEIIKMIGEAFLNPGDEVIHAWPTFSEYIFASKLMGAKPCSVPVGENFKHDLKKIAERVGSNTKLIFICNPNNPTGTIISRQEMQEFFEKIPSDIVVVVDEAYYEYVTDPQCSSAVELVDKNRVIVLRTFSKIYGLAGLRIGCGIASPDLISLINRVREPFNVNLMAQEAAVAALKDQAHVSQSKELVIDGKVYLYGEFERLGLGYIPSETNFIFVDIKRDSKEVFTALLKEGVIVRTGDIFDRPNYIRVTVGTPEQNKRFIICLEKVLGELA
ncbi:MAG TPA: histidinol-phosphate transaminase [Syntrophaceticus sp.]|nr:histidinol-phosphate transaminase [Syntrophaceticus schinkii]MDD4260564.1 histidinol-phosphate transaminase [Syntrophaceticus schinkii]MDD4674604.1 histidinol-phosphate transaminase [Syntrophaceticus schinkii]HHY29153.1 histidinol-phosphate transaminase [Syntrophaceticus sp.]